MHYNMLWILYILVPFYASAIDYSELPDNMDASEVMMNEASLGKSLPDRLNLGKIQDAFFSEGYSLLDNVTTIDWYPQLTPRLRLRFGMATTIILPDNEVISHVMQSNQFFTITPLKDALSHMVVIQPKFEGVDGNVILYTENKQVYNFYIFADPITSDFLPDLVVYVLSDQEHSVDNLSNTLFEPAIVSPQMQPFNNHYKLYGDKALAPKQIYDDGSWTYFDYRNALPSDRLPVIYKLVDGYETVVNGRMQHGFLVAESISQEGWTLRNGEQSLCVRPKKGGG